jgi:hypothetical protein
LVGFLGWGCFATEERLGKLPFGLWLQLGSWTILGSRSFRADGSCWAKPADKVKRKSETCQGRVDQIKKTPTGWEKEVKKRIQCLRENHTQKRKYPI